ncbi:5'-3' exonuclease H3TH domain-containing protein, partial [Patescibacteria group bacterium]
MTTTKKKKFIIIDANSLIHRAFHALPPLQTKDNVLVNAVYGFTTILLKALKDLKPDYIACCFDVDKNTFRKQEYKEYKAHRKEQPNELYHQFPLIKELLEAFKIPIYEKQGFEADDVIGTITKINNQKNKEIKNMIVSGDLDLLQLVNDNTEVYTMKRGISDTIIYNESAVKERFDFGPEKLIDYKALRGDASDNIPGVKGIGEKTGIALIKHFGSLDNLYKKIEKYNDIKDIKDKQEIKIIKPAVLKNLKEHKDDAYLSQKLVRIVQDVKIDFDLKNCKVEEFDTQHV